MKNILSLLFFIGFANGFSQTNKDYSFTYNNDSIIRAGYRAYEKEQYDEAIAQYNKISKTDPKYLTAQYEIALALSAQGKKVELKKHLEDTYKSGKMKDEPMFYTIYGSFLSDEKEYDSSEKIFKEGEKYLSNSSNFLYNQAILYLRKEEYQKSSDILKKTVTINPNLASAHYFLGSIALENGKVVEGSMALISYLAIAPTGKFAQEAISKLNEKFGENYLEKGKVVFSNSGDNFEELETILRNQLPLRKAYKVNSDFEDTIIRQIQAIMEYSATHKVEDGFFETTYIGWMKDIIDKKQFEGFSYYILLSLEEKLGKKLLSHKKDILTFYENYYAKSFWDLFAKRNVEHFGEKQDVVIYLEDGMPLVQGPIINGKKEGRFKLFGKDGKTTGELNFSNNELEGIQKYYDDNGNLEAEKTFKAGKLNGKVTEYYTNGNISSEENYKNDTLDGMSITYYVNGGKHCELNFTNGERNGSLTCYFENGTKNSEINFTNGKLNGKSIMYNEVGDITLETNYVDDQLDGKYVQFFDGKVIKEEGNYSKGKVQGNYKTYYSNKNIETENIYINGKITKAISYTILGKKSSESIYNENEELETYVYYDHKEQKYFEEKYKSGELKYGLQYSVTNPKPVEVNLTKKAFLISSFTNQKLVSGNFEKGKRNGEWNFYFTNGLNKIKENYVNGLQSGFSQTNNRRGFIVTATNYSENTINGLYESYDDGILDEVSYFTNGERNGPYTTFYIDGSKKVEGYFINNQMNFEKTTYRQNGSIMAQTKLINDEPTYYQSFDLKGNVNYTIDYKNNTGKQTINMYNGTTIQETNFKNGVYNGKLVFKDKLNTPIIDSEYVNGKVHNNYKYYSPLGTLMFERNYYAGKIIGKDTQYDLAGNLRITSEYTFGDENGTTTRYYHNKAKLFEYDEFEGSIENEYKYYNQKGELILVIGYENNAPIYYKTLGSNGEIGNKVDIKNETAVIQSNYPNGKIAMKISLEKGNINGKLVINSSEGKTEYEANYKNGLFDGDRFEYYPNGKLYKKEQLTLGNYTGVHTYFKEDGKPWLTANYKNDELHGDFLIYTNGVLSITKKYDSDDLVEIIK